MLAFFTTYDDVCTMRRFSRDILQWNKSDIKSTRVTTGDYSITYCLITFFDKTNPTQLKVAKRKEKRMSLIKDIEEI